MTEKIDKAHIEWIMSRVLERFEAFKGIVDKGQTPGELDAYEQERMLGRIDELNYIFSLLDMIMKIKGTMISEEEE